MFNTIIQFLLIASCGFSLYAGEHVLALQSLILFFLLEVVDILNKVYKGLGVVLESNAVITKMFLDVLKSLDTKSEDV